jgi:two-component system, chemotaxis family, protein-glutamate methylesterase/glutaminase
VPEVIAIGGSAGSLHTIRAIVEALPEEFSYAVIIVVHRLRNVASDMANLLGDNTRMIKIKEPEDKEAIRAGCVYLAPQNYHLQIEQDKTFSLDYSEPVHHSRPSIDVTFECVAAVYGDKAVGIVCSGANHDGADGLLKIVKKGGVGLVQDPATADYPYMPRAAIQKSKKIKILDVPGIVHYIQNIE